MKILYSLFIFLLISNLQVNAQQAGEAGDLLLNEINPDTLNDHQRYNHQKKGNSHEKNYYWNDINGYSEVFIRVPERGKFTIQIANQSISNSNGKFRFFDLQEGHTMIFIYQGDFMIYKTKINIRNNSRMVLDFFSDFGLYLLGVYPINNYSYGVNQWDDIWNKPYGEEWDRPRESQFGYAMPNNDFKNFLSAVRKESFDDDKTSLILSTANHIHFTAQQIKEIINLFSFDDNKLDVAKKLYDGCVDKHNYYLVYDGFTFSGTKDSLKKYILNK